MSGWDDRADNLLLLRSYLRTFRGDLSTPLYLIHFLTNRCNASCAHCFIPRMQEVMAGDAELSLDEHLAVIAKLGPELLNVNLTGGEIFMLPWVGEIIEAYGSQTSIRSMLLTTHGGFPSRTVEVMNQATSAHPKVQFVLSISMDGDAELHDRLRGYPGLFDTALRCYHELRKIQAPNLDVQACFCLQKANLHNWKEIIDRLVFHHEVSNLTCTWARDEEGGDPARQADQYEACSRYLDALIRQGKLQGYRPTVQGRLLNAKNIISRRVVRAIIKEDKFVSPCVAARLFGVIMANGDVHPCEILLKDSMGNLRDHDYDLESLWRGERNGQLRRRIVQHKCSCPFECAWTANILFTPRFLPELLYRAIKG